MKRHHKIGIMFSAVIAAVVFIWLVMFNNTKSVSSSIKSVTAEEFVSEYKKQTNAILLDVRTPAEYQSSYIPEAINIDFENSNFAEKMSMQDKDKTYFVYCRSGNRSGKAIIVMKNLGFKNIIELEGGILLAPELLLAH